MQFTVISFEKLFPTGAYMNEKIRVEVSLNLGDNPMDAIDAARKLVDENFEKNNPHLVTPDISIIPKSSKEMMASYDDSVPTHYNKQPTLEEQINSCSEIKTLESYKFIVKGKPELETIYNQKLNELSK